MSDSPGVGDRAAGTSATFSFEEALRNAVATLPPVASDVIKARVVEITATVGGFVGEQTLTVTVEREAT